MFAVRNPLIPIAIGRDGMLSVVRTFLPDLHRDDRVARYVKELSDAKVMIYREGSIEKFHYQRPIPVFSERSCVMPDSIIVFQKMNDLFL